MPRSYEKFIQQSTKEGKSVIKQFTGGRVPPTDPTLGETSFPGAPSWPCFLSVSLMTSSTLPLWMSASCHWFPNLHFQLKTPSQASCLLVELLATIFILMSQKHLKSQTKRIGLPLNPNFIFHILSPCQNLPAPRRSE